MKKKYFALTQSGTEATLNIYGDITSWPWSESDVSAYNLSKQLDELSGVSQIKVFINSYGGEVAEGLAIYNALKRHNAKVITYCDGFACSIASVIFMAGDERVMSESSLLMIHNAWSWAQGNADQLRKQADDLEKINQASVEAYKSIATISEDEIKSLMDNETWILPSEAIEYGFATSLEADDSDNVSQSVKNQLIEIVKSYQAADEEDLDEEDEESNEDEEEESEETSEEEESDEESDDEEDKTASQKMSGFFNAILKL